MTTQKAIEIVSSGSARLTTSRAIPRLRDDYILVKTSAIALNPTDWKHIDFLATPGALVGCDYSGTVLEVGPKLEDGTFAEYIVAKGDLQILIPDEMSFEEAATLGVGVVTVGQGLYQSLELPLPTGGSVEGDGKASVLIYGGSTATGTLAIQFAKLQPQAVKKLQQLILPHQKLRPERRHNLLPRNAPLLRQVGADAIFDYRDPDCGRKIREHTANTLQHAFDCVSEGSSLQICADALSSSTSSSSKPRYSALLGIKDFPREDVDVKATIGYTAVGEEVGFVGSGAGKMPNIPAKEEDARFANMFVGVAEGLLREGKIKGHPASVRQGGLGGVLEGLQEMREGKVSGEKLVYRVADTS
ncbi:cytochrome P450 [Physcia stellaris]|nr:cytochrome P450 [Physcia stellaris]